MSSRERTTQRLPSVDRARLGQPTARPNPSVPPTTVMDIADGLDRWALRREKNLLFRDAAGAERARSLAMHARFIATALDAGVREVVHDWAHLQQEIAVLVGAGSPDATLGALS